MSGSPDDARTPVQTPLERTEDSAVETLRDGTDELSETSDPPADLEDSLSPPEHEERAKLETSLDGSQETEIPLKIPLEGGPAERRSDPPEDDTTLCVTTGGSRVGASPGVPAEESGGEAHEPRAGASEPAAVRDIEEIGSSSGQDEAAGLRKRQLSETPAGKTRPRVPVVPGGEEDDDRSLTLNKCILVALVLVGVGFGIFDTESEGEEFPPESDQLNKREMDGQLHSHLELPPAREPRIDPYPDDPEGGPPTMIFLSALLDKLANENQQIQMIHVELQVQKGELETFLKDEGEKLPAESQRTLNQLNQQLSKHLQHEETRLSALQEELRDLRQKMTTMEGGSLKPVDVAAGSEKEVIERHLESFLTQKENLVAEALMLRQELDKQRRITISMRQALESLIEQVSTVGEDMEAPKILEGLEEMERKLAFELERSETWEKVYGKSKEEKKRKKEAKHASKNWGKEVQQEFEGQDSSSTRETSYPSPNVTVEESVSDSPLKTMEEAEDKTVTDSPLKTMEEVEDKTVTDPPLKIMEEAKDNSLSDPPLKTTQEAGDGSVKEKLETFTASVKSTFAQLSDAAKDLFPGDKPEPSKDKKHKEWKDKTHGWKHEKHEERDGSKDWKKTDEWKNKLREDKSREMWPMKQHKEWKDDLNVKRDHKDHHHDHQKKPEGHKYLEKDQKYKEHKRQKEPEKCWKESDERKQNEEVKHRHHDHNKFWKKDQELKYQKHRYSAPVSCTDVRSCARKEGMDLFNVALDPVRADEFRSLLKDYVQKSNLGSAWGGELEAMVATFFKEGVFIHDQMKFSDFVDDLEDYIEEMVEKLYGDDDAVEDFEDYVFRRLFGEATVKNKNTKKDKHKSMEHHHKSHEGHRSARNRHQHRQKDWESKWRPIAGEAGVEDKQQMAP